MKNTLVFLLILLSLSLHLSAQKPRSTLRIRLSDNSLLMVTINDRDYQKAGRTITIGDIPGKRQDIVVYRYRPYADGKGGKAERLFSGRVKLERGKAYEGVVDVQHRKLILQEITATAPGNQLTPSPIEQDQAAAAQVKDTLWEMPPQRTVSSRLQPLKKAMDSQKEDSKKLFEARKFLNQNALSTSEVKAISEWLFFDDTRLVFIKTAYPKVTDPENFASLESVFTLEENKKALAQFLKMK